MARRRWVRGPFAGRVQWCRKGVPLLVEARDIGGGGVRLRVAEPALLRSLLTLYIALPGEDFFTALGRVVHRRDDAMGVQFIGLPARHVERLDGLVAPA